MIDGIMEGIMNFMQTCVSTGSNLDIVDGVVDNTYHSRTTTKAQTLVSPNTHLGDEERCGSMGEPHHTHLDIVLDNDTYQEVVE